MDKEKAIHYLENSFLASLLTDEDITDISFNGVDIYYVSNSKGRMKSSISIEHQAAKDLLRQIANLTEKQFSYVNPSLDVSVGKYRINATHQSIGKINDEDVVTFSIRIASSTPRITDDSGFINPKLQILLSQILNCRMSIVIGGVTGSGKTEFQKYLLRKMRENERVIVIDNVMELDSIRNEGKVDLTCWQVDERNPYSSSALLIKNALRNNPDWLVVAEARDKEMVDVLNSAMTGAPIITTVHSFDARSLPSRMARLVQRNEQRMNYKEVLNDIYYHFHFYIYLAKEEDEDGVKRYISEIGYVSNSGEYTQIYLSDGDNETYNSLPIDSIRFFKKSINNELFKENFMKGAINE